MHSICQAALFTLVFTTADSGAAKGDFQWYLASTLSDFESEEILAGQSLNREWGTLAGLGAGIKGQNPRVGFSVNIDSRWGDLDYRGVSQAGRSVTTTTGYRLLEFEALGLCTLSPNSQELVATIGFGYQRRDRNIRGTSTIRGLDERYENTFVSLGLQGEWFVAKKHRLAWSGMFRQSAQNDLEIDFHGVFDRRQFAIDERRSWTASLKWWVIPQEHFRWFSAISYRDAAMDRSESVDLTQGGEPVGRLFQPEQNIQSLDWSIGLVITLN